MKSLKSIPDECPVCNADWISDFHKKSDSCQHFYCSNQDCNFRLTTFSGISTAYFMQNTFSDGTEIWWCSNGPSEIRRPGHKRYYKLDFVPPFNINFDRLKLLLIFS